MKAKVLSLADGGLEAAEVLRDGGVGANDGRTLPGVEFPADRGEGRQSRSQRRKTGERRPWPRLRVQDEERRFHVGRDVGDVARGKTEGGVRGSR